MPEILISASLKSWIEVSDNSDFPIQNIPFGVFLTPDDVITIGTRIGDTAIDLAALHQLGYFEGIPLTDDIFLQDTLNDFISDGTKTWRLVRQRIAHIFDANNATLRDNIGHREVVLFELDEIEMQLPVQIGDYTDFYSAHSQEEYMKILMCVSNQESQLSTALNFPLGYHGRSSSIVPSGIDIHRPYGQILPKNGDKLELLPSEQIDFELEMAFITTDANILGQSIDIEQAEDYIFGMVLFNNWGARDIQRWEYTQPGSFLGKNFASSISPWIVTLDALRPFRTKKEKQTVELPSYLHKKTNYTYDIQLEILLTTEKGNTTALSKTNYKEVFWTMAQQLAHHTVSGCKVNSGDLMASGAISGNTPKSGASLFEITNDGQIPVTLNDGSQRSYISDNDTITIKGYCKNEQFRIGFGQVNNKILKPLEKK